MFILRYIKNTLSKTQHVHIMHKGRGKLLTIRLLLNFGLLKSVTIHHQNKRALYIQY